MMNPTCQINHPRLCLLAVCALVFALCASAAAQERAKISRIGFLASSAGQRLHTRTNAFQIGLRELGYEERKNITVEYLSAEGKFDKLPNLASRLVKSAVHVIVAEGAPAAHAAKNATSTIPIVIGNAADPVGTGLVASLAHPGGNITGLSDFNFGVVTKRLEILKDVVPSATRIGVLWNPDNPTNPIQLKEISGAAPGLAVTLVPFQAKKPEDLERVLPTIARDRLGALVVLGDPMFGTYQRQISDMSVKARLAAIYGASESIDDGGLMSYSTNFSELYRRPQSMSTKS